VLYIYCSIDPSSPSSSSQVTEARNGLPFILTEQRFPEPLTDSGAEAQSGMPTFVMSVTDTGHVGNQHSVCRHPWAELGPTVGFDESAKISLNQVW